MSGGIITQQNINNEQMLNGIYLARTIESLKKISR